MSDGLHFTEFPPWEKMDFSKNCSVWGEWFATYQSPSPWDDTQYLDGDVKTIFALFNSSLPDDWHPPDNWTTGIYYGNVLDWYGFNYYSFWDLQPDDNISAAFDTNLFYKPWSICKKERCIALGWSGDMDLIGIGVFTSYWVEAVLATILLSTYTYWRLFRRSFPSYKNTEPVAYTKSKTTRLMIALQGSLQSFLDASKLFSIAMLIAALYTAGTGITQRVGDPTGHSKVPPKTALYDMMLSMLASTFSIFPVMVVYIIKRRDPPGSTSSNRRPLLFGIGVTTLIWVLSVMEAFMSLYGNFDYPEGEEDSADALEYNCDWRGSAHYWVGMRAAQYLLLACPLFLGLVTVFLVTGFGVPGVVTKPFLSQCRQYWRLAIAWINLLVMWGILGFFYWVRHKIDETVGHLNESNEWRFGQWLALFTWIPFVLHVLHKWMSGPELKQQGQTLQGARNRSDGRSMSTQTLNAPLVNPLGYAAVTDQSKPMQMNNLSADTSVPLNSEYSFPLSRFTTKRDAVEEWKETGW